MGDERRSGQRPGLVLRRAAVTLLAVAMTCGLSCVAAPAASAAGDVPAAPPFVTAVAGSLSATVSWGVPADGGSPITGYRIWVGQPGHWYPITTLSVPASTTTTTVPDLIGGQAYFFRVAALNAYGRGPWAGSTAVTIRGPAPAAPTGVVAEPGPTSARVTWSEPFDGGSPIVGYVVTPYLGAAAQPAVTFMTTSLAETVDGLASGSSYSFTVAAINGNGTGPASTPSVPVTIGAPTAPGMPTPVTSDRSVTLTWNRPASDNGSPIVGYVVTPYLNGVTALSTQTFMETLTTQTVTGLANGSSYRFTVAAINGVGTGPESTMSAAIVVGLGTVPAAPPSVSAVAGSLSATVSWSVPADGGAPITSYRVWVGRPGMWFPVTTLSVGPNATSTTVTGLTAGQVYFFRVAAVNGFGRGPWKDSNAVTILL